MDNANSANIGGKAPTPRGDIIKDAMHRIDV